MEEVKKISIWDILESITYTKKDLLVDEVAEKEYQPYLINRALILNGDTYQAANEMNYRHHLPPKLQNSFYINILRKRKRYNKWPKREKVDNIELVMEYYSYSYERARDIIDLLDDEQIDFMKRKVDKGGKG